MAVLTGGNDKHYAEGLVTGLTARGVFVQVVGSDQLVSSSFEANRLVRFLNLRRDQNPDAGTWTKVQRIIAYYCRLLLFVARTKAPVLHILWNNKFEHFDRTILLAYYKLCGKRLVFTAHNVNAAKRDKVDNRLNRLTLRLEYKLVDHIFVHTNLMRAELREEFRIPDRKISVIPFGINNSVPNTSVSAHRARELLDLSEEDRVLLFFGQIAPYKGLEYLLAALPRLENCGRYRLVIAGKPKWNGAYWKEMQRMIASDDMRRNIIQRIEFIPDSETELFFKAADVLVMPYVHIFQSGVLFLAYSFGLPVIATDVGSLREEIVEGITGFVCPRCDSAELAKAIERYFDSDLYHNLPSYRSRIKAYANERYSWDKVAQITIAVYAKLLPNDRLKGCS